MPGSIDEWTAAGVAAHRGETPEARLEGWEAAADAFRWHLAALDAEGWRGRVAWVRTISVKTLGVLRLNDAWHHGRDMAEAAGEGSRPTPRPSPSWPTSPPGPSPAASPAGAAPTRARSSSSASA